MSSDQAARQAALNPRESFIVQAPAGSGKTSLLIQRFLRLLTTVANPKAIIALSFTRKACWEMQARISAALQQAAINKPATNPVEAQILALASQALQHGKMLGWDLLAEKTALNITTIDAFNNKLAKHTALNTSYLGQAALLDNPTLFYQEAVQLVFTTHKSPQQLTQAISIISKYFNHNLECVSNLCVKMLAKRNQWLPHLLGQDKHTLRETLETALQELQANAIQHLSSLIPTRLSQDLLQIARTAATNLQLQVAESWQDLPSTSAGWRFISTLLLTKSLEWRKKFDSTIGLTPNEQASKALLTKLIAQLRTNPEIYHALQLFNTLPKTGYDESHWSIIAALQTILTMAVAELTILFNERNHIDYLENELLALTALGGPEHASDLALALHHEIQHILVDEFQDTSATQWALLRKLTAGWSTDEGRSLLVVGDPMQSIYRFRAAAVSIFQHAWQHGIGQLRLTPLVLSCNFRAKPALVAWCNNAFSQIFTNTNTQYYPSTASKIASAPSNVAAEYHECQRDDTHSQAQRIIKIIQRHQAQDPHASIAILARTRSHLTQIIKTLKTAQLPFTAPEIALLTDNSVINDLLNLSKAVLYPGDKIAWLAILRAPWIGLSLADLAILSTSTHKFIWHSINDPSIITTLSPAGQVIIMGIKDILLLPFSPAKQLPVDQLIQQLYCLLNEQQLPTYDRDNIEKFFATLSMVVQESSLHNDDIWQNLVTVLRKEYAVSIPAPTNSLSIMTIHNAKGLEFDTVIVPHLEKPTTNRDKPLLLWQESGLEQQESTTLLAALPKHPNNDGIYDYLWQIEQRQQHYEEARLLYVAATRAKQALHLLYSIPAPSAGKPQAPPSRSMLQHLWPIIKPPHSSTHPA